MRMARSTEPPVEADVRGARHRATGRRPMRVMRSTEPPVDADVRGARHRGSRLRRCPPISHPPAPSGGFGLRGWRWVTRGGVHRAWCAAPGLPTAVAPHRLISRTGTGARPYTFVAPHRAPPCPPCRPRRQIAQGGCGRPQPQGVGGRGNRSRRRMARRSVAPGTVPSRGSPSHHDPRRPGWARQARPAIEDEPEGRRGSGGAAPRGPTTAHPRPNPHAGRRRPRRTPGPRPPTLTYLRATVSNDAYVSVRRSCASSWLRGGGVGFRSRSLAMLLPR